MFQIRKKDLSHRIFAEHREILSNITGEWEVCAVLSYKPLSGILPPTSGHLKVINKYLYQSDIERTVWMLLNELQITFKSVSRLDIALDFKKFSGKVHPADFLRRLLSRKILKRRSCGFHLDGKLTRQLPLHYMRFGGQHSDVHFYIYNKSKELREKTDKPYIRDKWKQYGIGEANDTWRMEFVLHPSKFGCVETSTGETIEFNNTDILKPEFIERLFFSLVDKYAAFVKNDGQKRKERMKEFPLFKSRISKPMFLRITEKDTSNRMDKVFIKKLYLLNKEWRFHNKDDTEAIANFLHDYIEKKDLRKWFDERININPQFETYDTARDLLQRILPNVKLSSAEGDSGLRLFIEC